MSIRFQADADFNFEIVKAVRRIERAIDFASADESALRGVRDADVLQRAAVAGRVLLSHDRNTTISEFRHRIASGESSPGLAIAEQSAAVGPVAEAIVLLWAANDPAEMRDRVLHLPSLAIHQFAR